MGATKLVGFAGKLLEEDGTVFMIDQDSKDWQFAIEPVDGVYYDLTFAIVDENDKRKEYVLTTSERDLKFLADKINSTLKS